MVAVVLFGGRGKRWRRLTRAMSPTHASIYSFQHSRLVEWVAWFMVLAVIVSLLLILSAWLFHL